MAKFKQRKEARELRQKGNSIKSIAKKLGVSTGSVSIWCRNIALTENQIKALEKQGKDPYYGRRMQYLLRIKKETEEKTEKLLKEGIKDIGRLDKRELLLVGAALYWAEGFKKDSQVGFANSSPEMIKVFLRWIGEYHGYKKEDLIFRVTANISHKYRIREIENYWANIVNVYPNDFQKPFFQKFAWKKEYENPEDYHGVLRVRVRKSKDFLRKIHGYIEGLSSQD